jgi:hypothetical protein
MKILSHYIHPKLLINSIYTLSQVASKSGVKDKLFGLLKSVKKIW